MKLIIFLFLLIGSTQSQNKVTITYMANEGVLIQTNETTILIDALFRSGGAYGYEKVQEYELKKMEGGLSPYNQNLIILVSHLHADHFDPESVASLIKNNSKAKLYSSKQVINSVSNFLNEKEKGSQLFEVTPKWKESKLLKIDKVEINFIRLRHGYYKNYSIHNLGHIIHIAGKKILHIGDAERSIENFSKFNLAQQKIDVGLLPDWFLRTKEGVPIIKQYIKVKSIIAVHVHPKDRNSIKKQFKADFPFADAFTIPLEKRVFK